jgi:hypothetical protein
MTAPVTVIGSAVVCFLFVELGCANAKGASSKQTSMTVVLFMMPPFLMSKLPEVVWIEQEPLHIFATVQFHVAAARSDPNGVSGRVCPV